MLSGPSTHRGTPLPKLLSHLSLTTAAVAFALLAAELLVRALVPPVRGYAVLPPGADWTLVPAPGLLPGVEGTSHVRVNRLGVRGRLFGNDRTEYRLLAVGGSTTLCRALDDSEVWTHLLERELDRTMDGKEVWVGNVGRDGMTTRDNVIHLKYLLQQYPRIDVVVSLVGVNDLVSALQQGWHYRPPTPVTEPDGEREEIPRAFAVVPGRLEDTPMADPGGVPWYKATALWQLGRRAKLALRTHRTIMLGGTRKKDPLDVARLARASAPKIDSIPPLAAPLIEYRRNLNAMADLALAAGVGLVFVTQPAAWNEGASGAEGHQLWMGAIATEGPSGRVYLSSNALARVMARYNEVLLDVCRQRSLACVDAAHVIPRDTTALYDDVHLNEQGARLLARTLAAYFRQHAPFLRPT